MAAALKPHRLATYFDIEIQVSASKVCRRARNQSKGVRL